jgi:hypothetical protein
MQVSPPPPKKSQNPLKISYLSYTNLSLKSLAKITILKQYFPNIIPSEMHGKIFIFQILKTIKFMSNYYSYQSETYQCRHCGWSGPGTEVLQGEVFEAGFEVDCPKCHETFRGLIVFPTIEDALEKGSEKEKESARAAQASRTERLASHERNLNQLPELEDEGMAFVLKEIQEGDAWFIVITYQDTVIWKEERYYEYYNRFIEIGNLLKDKYGDNMIDLVPGVYGACLFGDNYRAVGLIEDYRKGLRNEEANS